MKEFFRLFLLFGLALDPFLLRSAEYDPAEVAAEIDALVEAGLEKNEIEPNEPIDDATFLRRVYLDIVGRIPTIEEAENFHGSTYERKRGQLIADLLASDGHVSHAYNFWADILRINNALSNGARQAEAAYRLWLLDALESNKSYDEFVRELVSARGMIWENGAVGYYLRDRGMPLDNMSNTVRVFLGTRLECAQCHNHPFDDWTQMDYYKMAAFSYGMVAGRYGSDNRSALNRYQRELRLAEHQKAVKLERFPVIANEGSLERYVSNPKYDRYLKRLGIDDGKFRQLAQRSMKAQESYRHKTRGLSTAVNELYNPLRYVSAEERKRTLKLPHDYQYDDAEPEDAVAAATMFGAAIDLENVDGSAIEAYAAWLTAEDNPTFTKVIANRLWKRVFGHGVFEPVDELTDYTQVANPELLARLEDLMRELGYDMRRYLEVLYNTESYQRAAHREEVALGEPYHFPGPVLRRMTAEQIWDSLVALALPEADSYRPRLKQMLASVESVRRIHEALEGRSEEEFLAMIEELSAAMEENADEQERLRQALYKARETGKEERVLELRREYGELRREARRTVSEIGYRHAGEKVDGEDLLAAIGMNEASMEMMAGSDAGMNGGGDRSAATVYTALPRVEMREPPEGFDRKQVKMWNRSEKQKMRVYRNLIGGMARASEMESPARRGHFLREFGQSDREVIENASTHASVPQALNLLNGPMVEVLINPYAVFGARIHEAGDPEEKMRMIFQAMLTREPTGRELQLALGETGSQGDRAYEGVVWALLNTQQFLFVQ